MKYDMVDPVKIELQYFGYIDNQVNTILYPKIKESRQEKRKKLAKKFG